MSVSIETEPNVIFGNPEELPIRVFGGFGPRNYDVTPDGQRFLTLISAPNAEVGETTLEGINVVLNWFEELKRRVPTGTN